MTGSNALDLDDFDPRIEQALWRHGSSAVAAVDVAGLEITPRSAWSARVAVMLAFVAIVGAVGLVATTRPLRETASAPGGVGPAASCAVFSPDLREGCKAAQGSISWGPIRVDSVRVWLTTLGAVKEAFNPRQQVEEPPLSTPVWVFVFDGLWSCCLVGNPDGSLTGPIDMSRWLHVVDATQPPDGSFIYIHDWSGRDVPERLPSPTEPAVAS